VIARETPPRRGRRVRRHLLLASVAAGLGLVVYLLVDRDRVQARLSMATAYASLLFLGATLLLGPLRVLRGKHSPANTYLRRDLGIWAGLLALAHTAAGLTVHFPGRMWKYFFDRVPSLSAAPHLRLDGFGVANHTGLASALVLILLLALSNDRSLRALGTSRWKGLQRWSYLAFALTAAHGALYQAIQSRAAPGVGVFAVVVAAVVGAQLAGYAVEKRRGRA
jgi:sulfoxide reductase heme-binding subunit YedZ